MTVIEITNEYYYCDTTITLDRDGILRGTGSKHCFLISTANPIIEVESNMGASGDYTKTAIIENLMISGWGATNPDQIGILLNDVYNCQIRNVTIVNCGKGIQLGTTYSAQYEYMTYATNIEHVRMNHVYNGITFAKEAGSTGDFGFTHITDTSMTLHPNPENLRGIEVNTGCKLHNSFIKANVWSCSPNCCAMYIDGDTRYNLIHVSGEAFRNPTTDEKMPITVIKLGPNAVLATQQEDYNQEIYAAKLDGEDTYVDNYYCRLHNIVNDVPI